MVLVDPSLTSDYAKYRGATVITPNRKETSSAVGYEITDKESAAKAAEELAEKIASDRQTMIDLLAQIEDLKEEVMQEKYEHWKTCDGEGLEWHGPVPEAPEPFFGEKLP